MSERDIAAVVLAAGKGTRMESAAPKVLHRIAGRPMIGYVLDAVAELNAARTVVVVGPDMNEVADLVAPADCVVQAGQRGTADAVAAAREALAGFEGVVLVVYGDTPLLAASTLAALVEGLAAGPQRAVMVLGFRPADPGPYGRLVATGGDGLEAIVEALDATPEQLAIELCCGGVMAIDGRHLFALLDAVDSDNAKGEYYLTDIVAIARGRGLECGYVEAPEQEVLGVNSRAELAAAEAAMQRQLRERAMLAGATLIDPESVHLCYDTRLGRDVTVGPNVVFGPGVAIGDGAEIRPFCHLEGAEVAGGAVVGPFARLRPGTRIGREARVGNYVEVKNAVLEPGAKANHLSYIGDARIGAGANIGAGTITCNYDGFEKSFTDIGKGAFIGSNTALVAPVVVGDGAIVGAGSVVTKDVAADALAVSRAEQTEVPGGGARFRQRKRLAKSAKAGKAAGQGAKGM